MRMTSRGKKDLNFLNGLKRKGEKKESKKLKKNKRKRKSIRRGNSA